MEYFRSTTMGFILISLILCAGCSEVTDPGFHYIVNGTVKNMILTQGFGITYGCNVLLTNGDEYRVKYYDDCVKLIIGNNVSFDVYQRFHALNENHRWVTNVTEIP